MKDIQTILTHYLATEKTEKILIEKGYKIICIAYGYMTFCDLIVYEVHNG